MKSLIGKQVKIRDSYIKWSLKNAFDCTSVAGKLDKEHAVDYLKMMLLGLRYPYKAKIIKVSYSPDMNKVYLVKIRFSSSLVEEMYIEKKDFKVIK